MRTSCANCLTYKLSYKQKLKISPSWGYVSFLECPNCKTIICSTFLSRLLFILFLLLATINLGLYSKSLDLTNVQLSIIVASIFVLAYFIVWPIIVRTKKWKPLEDYLPTFRIVGWLENGLPKSRIVGYFLFLLLPIFFMVCCIFVAIKLNL